MHCQFRIALNVSSNQNKNRRRRPQSRVKKLECKEKKCFFKIRSKKKADERASGMKLLQPCTKWRFKVTCSWARLGPSATKSFRLDNGIKTGQEENMTKRNRLYNQPTTSGMPGDEWLAEEMKNNINVLAQIINNQAILNGR